MIKKSIILIIVSLLLSSCQTTRFYDAIDKNWNVNFYDNCALPKDSVMTLEENNNKFLRFQLKGGQKGSCWSDKKARHGAPYWERAELKQSAYLHKNSVYEIKFKARFVSGFEGTRETFFQIHQYNKDCRVGPMFMLKSRYGKLHGDFSSQKEFKIKDNKNKWINFKINLDFPEGLYSVNIDGKNFISGNDMGYRHCGKPHIKFGIYRPGWKKNKKSVIDFDNFQLTKIE